MQFRLLTVLFLLMIAVCFGQTSSGAKPAIGSTEAQQSIPLPGPGEEMAAPPRPTLTGNDPKPQDATKAILAAFGKFEVVGMGAAHGNQDLDQFILNLIRDPELPGKVNDIVVECGNSLYQPILDRYIAGDDVPLDQARQVWRNTTQPMCSVSEFYEELFRWSEESIKGFRRKGDFAWWRPTLLLSGAKSRPRPNSGAGNS
jgi:hypothetical protein